MMFSLRNSFPFPRLPEWVRGIGWVWFFLVVLTTGPARSQAAFQPIEVLIQSGSYAQAVEALRVLPEPSGRKDYLLGFALIQLYRFDEAEEALRRAVEDDPTQIDRLHALAKSLLEQGKNLAAISILDQALAIEARPDLYFARAMCALRAGRTGQAEKDLEASLAGQARNPEALYKLGRLELDRGRYEAAAERLRVCLEVTPDHTEARFSLGVADLRMGNAEASIVAFEKVLEAVPGHVGALYNLARAFQAEGRPADAQEALTLFRRMSAVQDEVDFLEQAVQKNPENVDGRLALVNKLLELGRSERALQQATIARQLAPQQPLVYKLLAGALARLGRDADARQAMDFAHRLETGS